MTAYECDRCGALFKREHMVETRIVKKKPICNGGFYYLDLCPRCQKEFENWLDEAQSDSSSRQSLRNGA